MRIQSPKETKKKLTSMSGPKPLAIKTICVEEPGWRGDFLGPGDGAKAGEGGVLVSLGAKHGLGFCRTHVFTVCLLTSPCETVAPEVGLTSPPPIPRGCRRGSCWEEDSCPHQAGEETGPRICQGHSHLRSEQGWAQVLDSHPACPLEDNTSVSPV